MHEVPTTGVWQRGRLRLPVKQSPTRTRWFAQRGALDAATPRAAGRAKRAIHPHPQHCRASSIGRAAASKAEGSRFDSVVRCQRSRRSQAAEGIWLQTRRRKPTSVRSGRRSRPGRCEATGRRPRAIARAIGSSSPGLVSSADESSRLLPGGSAVRVGHEAPVHFPDSADGRAPGC